MTRNADVHIRVTEETWSELNAKKGPGDSFEDVIQELLDEIEEGSEGGNPKTPPTPTVD